MAKPKKLTNRQWRFVHEYLKDQNGAKAAIRAGYSAHSAKEMACENLTKPHLKAEIDARIEESNQRCTVTREILLERLAYWAMADMPDYVEWGPNGIKLKPDGQLGKKSVAIEKITDSPKLGVSVELRDSQKALESLWEKLGFDKHNPGRDRQAHSDRIRAAMERVKQRK